MSDFLKRREEADKLLRENGGRPLSDFAGEEGRSGEHGIIMTYPDGQTSWIAPRSNIDFGLAIVALKQGKRVARSGWNGKGMFLILDQEPKTKHSDFFKNNGIKFVTMEVCPTICMKTADDKIVMGWLASQTDMLAEDWQIIE